MILSISKSRLLGSDCSTAPILLFKWIVYCPSSKYEKLNNSQFKNMKRKFVIDSRRMLSDKQLDVDYFAIGLGKENWNTL